MCIETKDRRPERVWAAKDTRRKNVVKCRARLVLYSCMFVMRVCIRVRGSYLFFLVVDGGHFAPPSILIPWQVIFES